MKSLVTSLWFCLVLNSAVAQTTEAPPDSTVSDSLSLSPTADSLMLYQPDPSPLTITLQEDQLADLDHEEFGDWIAVMPGFYPLDRATLSSPYYGQMLGMSPAAMGLFFRGRRLEDPLLGAPELSWIPSGTLTQVRYNPLPLETPGVWILADLRSMQPLPPSSRISTRDGFYGSGYVDFDFSQKVTPAVVLNGGGRVANFDGRFPHSKGYGLNLRTEVACQVLPHLQGWVGLMQNKLNSQVPYSNVNYNRDRYEADLNMTWKTLNADLYGIQQREIYAGGQSDGWDEFGLVLKREATFKSWRGQLSAQAAAARWRLKGRDWSATSFGGANLTLYGQPYSLLKVAALAGLDLSDDFQPARHLGVTLSVPVVSSTNLFTSATQHQRFPSRYETAADFTPGTHFTPYDPVILQNPSLNLVGNPGLGNETYNQVLAGVSAKSPEVEGALAGFWRAVEHPIGWEVEGGNLHTINGSREEGQGLLGWGVVSPIHFWELGATGSWMPLKSGEQRIFPEMMGHFWAQVRKRAFQDELELRLRVWEDYWGKRQFPMPGGWESEGDSFVLSARFSARLAGVHLFYQVTNILKRTYELFPGYPMMHKEEVWGITWVFTN